MCKCFISLYITIDIIDNDYPSPKYEWWVKELSLEMTEKTILQSRQQVNNRHVQAIASIFNKQFEELPPMTPSVSFQNPKKVKKASDGHIQIHYYQNHWVVSQTL